VRPSTVSTTWAQRADAAEAAVLHRHLRRLWCLPRTRLGVVAWPPAPAHRTFLRWHYWWQAHLLDCLVDAFAREPTAQRRGRAAQLARGIRLRNLGRWSNNYYDDMAWLGLALERTATTTGVRHPDAVRTLAGELERAWSAEAGGGIPWRKGDAFRNVPANGPAAILLARTGNLDRARATADWINANLTSPATGLVWDGLRPGAAVEQTVYSYCQGVVLGAETELTLSTGELAHRQRVHRLVGAVAEHLSTDGVLQGAEGGDGGLFAGILARYLALVAARLPGDSAADEQAREQAGSLVLASARSAWANRAEADGRPLFGPQWDRPAVLPEKDATGRLRDGAVSGSVVDERDLSVQLSGWMLMEAAAVLDRPRPAPR